jgi:hypothetical protein
MVTLDVLARRGAQEMLKAALEIEVEEWGVQRHPDSRT